MNILHAAIRFNPKVLPKLVDFIEDKLYLTHNQKRNLLNGQTVSLGQSPLHFAARFGFNKYMYALFQTHDIGKNDITFQDSRGKIWTSRLFL